MLAELGGDGTEHVGFPADLVLGEVDDAEERLVREQEQRE